jgi:hypothetical protein
MGLGLLMGETGTQNTLGASHSAGKWVIVILLSVIATCLLIEVGASSLDARGAQAGVDGGAKAGLFAVAGQITRDTYGMYLVDAERGTICVYQYVPTTRKLHLRAARNITFDLLLDAYNTELPPQEIKKLVEQHRRLKEKAGP